MKIINSTKYQKYQLKYERKFAQTKRVFLLQPSRCIWIWIFEFQIFIDILWTYNESDIELEFIIFIQVKIIIHVYNFCCKKYVVTVKNRML